MTQGRERGRRRFDGQTTSGQCGFNQAASHQANPIKRHRARRDRSHPKAMLTTQTSAVALDVLENSIQEFRNRAIRATLTGELPFFNADGLGHRQSAPEYDSAPPG